MKILMNDWDSPIICLPRIWVRPPCMFVNTWGLLTESGWLKDHKEKDGQVYILKHLQNWETNILWRDRSHEEVPFIKYFRIYEKSLKPNTTLLLFRFCVHKNVIISKSYQCQPQTFLFSFLRLIRFDHPNPKSRSQHLKGLPTSV